jgi:hypothetical protein
VVETAGRARTNPKEQHKAATAVQMFDIDGTPLSQGVPSPGLNDEEEAWTARRVSE